MVPLISIIIPVYNRTQYLSEAIESVLAQTYKNYEIIVVDDGSSIDITNVIAEYKNRIMYIRQENKGLAGARNTGIKNSQGRYLAFLDDDDLFEPCKLEAQVSILENNREVGFVYSNCYEFTEGNPTARLNLAFSCDNSEFAKFFFMDPGANIRVPTVLIRRECFDKVGLFDETLLQHEDGDLLLRAGLIYKVAFSEYPSARVRTHDSNMSSDKIVLRSSIIKSLKKILSLNPEFNVILGNDVNIRFSQLHFMLGEAYLRKRMFREAWMQFQLSKNLSKKYVTFSNLLKMISKIVFGIFLSYVRKVPKILRIIRGN